MPKDKLYFVAIVAPHDVAREINVFKYDIRDNYGSKAALKTMPHITLKAPFKLPAEDREGLLKWFSNIYFEPAPFTITIENFGCFDNRHNKVIYVKPILSQELSALQSTIIKNFVVAYPQINMSTHEHQFNPHLTIGYRDLTPENFAKAWDSYRSKQYHSRFTCDSFCLLQHNGMKWEVIAQQFIG